MKLRRLFLRRQVMTNLDSILKSRDITLPTKVKAKVFPVVMYGCESWTVKKTECWKIDALNYGVREDSWESPGLQGDPTSPSWRRSVLGLHWKDWCWSWNCNTLATSCEELTHWKRPWCWEGLGAGGEVDDRGWDGWMASPTRWAWVWVNSGSCKGQGGLACCNSWDCRVGHDWVTELNWKFSKPGSGSMWTVNFQMFKLVLEKAEKSEIKLPTSNGSSKSKRVPEKHILLLYWLCQSLWLCGSQ